MSRLDRTIDRTSKKRLLAIIILEAALFSYFAGTSYVYQEELKSIKTKISNHEHIPLYIKKQLIHGYSENEGE